MAKPLQMTPNLIDAAIQEFRATLEKTTLNNGRVSYSKEFTYGSNAAHATLIFSQKAWVKICTFVMINSQEAAWHGTVTRDEETHTYRVDDIFVYPQHVTGASVRTNDKEMFDWMIEIDPNDDGEIINHMRLQGHSHVNFSTSPSATDLETRQDWLGTLRKDDFYVFLIVNKSLDVERVIYDFKQNILYEKQDITVKVEGMDIDAFIADSKRYVRSGVTYATLPSSAKVFGETPKPTKKATIKSIKDTTSKKKKSRADLLDYAGDISPYYLYGYDDEYDYLLNEEPDEFKRRYGTEEYMHALTGSSDKLGEYDLPFLD